MATRKRDMINKDKQPVGVVMLFNQNIRELDNDVEPVRPNKFVIHREGSVPFYLSADTIEARSSWVEIIGKTVNECQDVDNYLEETKRNLTIAPTAISDPDCFGYLIKLGNQWKSRSRRYCVLKDAALYFYNDSNAANAVGVALFHGYKVQQSLSSKKHAFEIVPPDPTKKHFYFQAESDTDRRRWISALEYSIDRWLKLH